jgi:hypothetical protein
LPQNREIKRKGGGMKREFEAYHDKSFYGLWRVRRENWDGMSADFHVYGEDSAEELRDLLNELERDLGNALEQAQKMEKIALEVVSENTKNLINKIKLAKKTNEH